MKEKALLCKDDLLKYSSSKFVTKYIMDSTPSIFLDNKELYLEWQHDLSDKLNVDPKDIIITGSSTLGFSLNPVKNFSEFNENSDIDIGIISNYYFNLAWSEIKNIKNYNQLSNRMQNSIDDHKSKYIYYGTIATDKIWTKLSFGPSWEQTMTTLRKKYSTTVIGDRVWNFRIYIDNDAFRTYQCLSVKKAGHKLLSDKTST